MSVVVGVTGVMGSGKSSVIEVLGMLGVPHYNCDQRAKEIMKTPRLRGELTEILGTDAYTNNGELNRGFISEKIFSDRELKEKVELSVHTALRDEMRGWIRTHSDHKYVVIESAILYGSIIERDMDYVVAVVVDEAELLDRIMTRDGLPQKSVEARLASQMPQNELLKRADFSVTTAKKQLLTPKVIALHEKLLSLQNDKQ